MKRLLPALSVLVTTCALAGVVAPFEKDEAFVPVSPLDTHVLTVLKAKGIQPAALCADEVFLRRVYLDVIGTLPRADESRRFLEDPRPNKRALLIDELMQRDEFADYWALKWCDLLRVKSEFPINLWPNAVQAYHHWIRQALKENWTYDRFARELLTSSGSNFRVPPVNFYRAVQDRRPEGLAAAAGLTFMGTRLDAWPAAKRTEMAAFFSRVAYKKTGEWKEEIVYLDPTAALPLMATLPDGTKVKINPDQDPRETFANWLLTPANPWFARAMANRVWSWFMGRGIIHEPDDIRADNPPVNAELLAYLTKELVGAKFDGRHLFRLILNSRTYQQSALPRSQDPKAEALFACYPVRRLPAEVLIDALCWIGGKGESYSSPIPEPFTYIPENQRSIALADGSITSSFLETFGRPTRDTGQEAERLSNPSDAQRLYLLNSLEVQQRIERSPVLQKLMEAAKGKRQDLIPALYLTLLSRYPTAREAELADKYYQTGGLSLKQATDDLAWALINSKEFLYRH